MDRKVCRLCAKLKPINFLFPFYGTDYEQIVDNFLPFGLHIKKNDNLPKEICQTCSKKLLNCKHTIESFIKADKKLKLSLPTIKNVDFNRKSVNLRKDVNFVELQLNKILPKEIKQDVLEIATDKLKTEMDIENEEQAAVETSFNTEIVIKDECLETCETETDPLNVMSAEYEEVIEFNGNKGVIGKVEPSERGEKENVENTITEVNIKEEFDNLTFVISDQNFSSVNAFPQAENSLIELFECCDCKKLYITKEAVISHITNVHAKGKATYHAKFEKVRENVTDNSSNEQSFTGELKGRKMYHRVVRPVINKTVNKLFTGNICGLTVKKNSTLKDHMMRHRQDSNDQTAGFFKCSVCKRMMTSQHLLNCHENLHKGVKYPFACEKCNEKFNEYRKWYLHQKMHVDRSFRCKICGKTFRTKQTMKYHVTRVHMKQKQYECLSCRKHFKYMSALTYHVKNLECKTLFGY